MISEIEDFGTGWYGIYLGFSPEEIDRLVVSLQELKNKKTGHFHIFDDHTFENSGIADIEIFLKGKDEKDNMIVK